MSLLSPAETVTAQIMNYRCVAAAGLANGCGYLEPHLTVSIGAKTMSAFNKSFDTLEKDLNSYRKNGYRTILYSPSRTRARRLAQDLMNDGITAFYSENPERRLEPGEIMTCYGQIKQGYRDFFRMVDDCIVQVERELPSEGYKDFNDELLGREDTEKKAVGCDIDGDGAVETEESNEEKHKFHR